MMRQRSVTLTVVAPIVAMALILLGWQLYVQAANVSQLLLPAPTAILAQTAESFEVLLRLSGATAADAGIGLAWAIALSVLLAWLIHPFEHVSSFSTSVSTAMKTLPLIALYPIAVIFLGSGPASVVTIVCLSTLPVMFHYALQGLRQRSELDDLMKVIAASGWKRFTTVRIPLAIPHLLTGLKTAAPLSIIAAVVTEYFGGTATSLGAYISSQSGELNTVEMWSAIVMACLLGCIAFLLGMLCDRLARRFT